MPPHTDLNLIQIYCKCRLQAPKVTPGPLFGTPWAPRTDPSVPKRVPREPQRPTKCPQGDPRGPKGAPRRPKGRPKETPKPPPRHPKKLPKTDPEPGDLISSKQSSRLHGNPPQEIRQPPHTSRSGKTCLSKGTGSAFQGS